MFHRPMLVSALALAASGSLAAHAQERQSIAGGPEPLRYQIAVTPDMDANTFAGDVAITIAVDEPTDTVVMNALGLTIDSAEVDGVPAAATLDGEAQTLTLTLDAPLAAGEHVIDIEYDGVIQQEAYGLFSVDYSDETGPKTMLATQFEPGDARRFAPMWDQPDRRAVFSLTVTAPEDLMTVGNMPVETQTPATNGMVTTTFADTPKMPSYLLFLAVGDLERTTRDVDGVQLGLVVRRGELDRTGAAMDAGEQVLRYYTDYFGVPYPLPKLDMLGVPGAGGFGAMENWGAIMYFDQYLLVDAGSSEAERQNVFGIVAHEIAHQWFGNLVTMAWWDDLWLNEGFASWMASKVTAATHPDWDIWLTERAAGIESAMTQDSRAGTHPIVQVVNTIDEANLAFDSITYNKGQAVIRMMEAYVGEDAFRQGVRDYIGAHMYGSARTAELWTAVEGASGQPVIELADAFTRQPGFPVLTVADTGCTAEPPSGELSISQTRYATDEVSRTDEIWPVPVVARRLGAEPVRTVIPAEADTSIDAGPACGAYLVNAGQTGYFRVLYDTYNLKALELAFPQLDGADQLGLLLDYWAFGRSGEAPITDFLNLSAAVPADASPVIVNVLSGDLAMLAGYAKGRESEDMVRAYTLARLKPYFDALGWEPGADEGSTVLGLRASLITTLGSLGDEGVIAKARELVAASETDPAALPASIRNAVLSVYAANATPDEHAGLVAKAMAATDFVEQRRLWLRAAAVKDESTAKDMLDLTLGDTIPRTLRTQVIRAVAGNHPRMAWDFLKANRAAIETLLDPLQRLEYPARIATASADPAIAAELEAYAADFPDGAKPTIAAATASILLRAETISGRMPAVEAWMAGRMDSEGEADGGE